MSKSSLVMVPLVLVVVAGLLITGGWAVHRIGWSEGYAAGIGRAAGGVGSVPYAPTGLSYAGLFLTAGLAFLMLMGLLSKLVGLWAFRTFGAPLMMAHRRAAGPVRPNGERWAAHWHTPHRHVPPWCWGWGETGEAPPTGDKGEASGGANSAST